MASFALDVRENNEFRICFIHIDAFDPAYYCSGKVARTRALQPQHFPSAVSIKCCQTYFSTFFNSHQICLQFYIIFSTLFNVVKPLTQPSQVQQTFSGNIVTMDDALCLSCAEVLKGVNQYRRTQHTQTCQAASPRFCCSGQQRHLKYYTIVASNSNKR